MERDPINLTLDIFNPNKGEHSLENTSLTSGLILDTRFSVKRLYVAATRRDPRYLMTDRGKTILNNVNNQTYDAINTIFQLQRDSSEHERETPFSFYRRHMKIANKVITQLVGKLCPTETTNLGLKNQVAFIPDPAEIVPLVYAPYPYGDLRVKYEVVRQVGLALSSAQVESADRALEGRLKDINKVLDLDLFNNGHGQQLGHSEDENIYALHDRDTNEVLWVSTIPDSQQDPSLIPNAVLKRYTISMRKVDDTIGWVMTNPRLKDEVESVKKTTTVALDKKRSGENNGLIQPTLDVRDKAGIKFVVANEFSHNGTNVSELAANFIFAMQKNFSTLLDPDNPFEHKETSKSSHQSKAYSDLKILVHFVDLDQPVEVIFTGLGEELNNSYRVGNVDPLTGIPDGQAHDIYEDKRDLEQLALYFPEPIYHLKLPRIKLEAYGRTISRLLSEHIVTNPSEIAYVMNIKGVRRHQVLV